MLWFFMYRDWPTGPQPLPKICITINVVIESATITITGTNCKK